MDSRWHFVKAVVKPNGLMKLLHALCTKSIEWDLLQCDQRVINLKLHMNRHQYGEPWYSPQQESLA